MKCLADKNYAGFVYAVFGLLVINTLEKRWHQILVLIISAGLLWQTGSRTSLTAMAFAYLWILFSPKLMPILKICFLGLLWLLQDYLTINFSDSEVFGDREGTDALRARIDEWSWGKVQETGFFGQGLGEAYVYSEDGSRTWFFHNSYWSAFVEGGWPWAVGLVGITLFFMVAPQRKNSDVSYYEVLGQGAGITLLICSIRLGEVFYTMPWAICLGFVLRAMVIRLPENNQVEMYKYDQKLKEAYQG